MTRRAIHRALQEKNDKAIIIFPCHRDESGAELGPVLAKIIAEPQGVQTTKVRHTQPYAEKAGAANAHAKQTSVVTTSAKTYELTNTDGKYGPKWWQP